MQTALGVDIGGTNIRVILMSGDGNVLSSITEPTPVEPEGSPDSIKKALVRTLKNSLKDTAIGIGFGVAGIIDRQNGSIFESPNIPSLNGFPLKQVFEKEFSLPVMVENDANAYAYGEKLAGSGKNLNNFVVLTLGTGLGGGVIYKGGLLECPVEVGHMVIDPGSSGRFCTCGSFGCLESYTSGRAITERAISSLDRGSKSILKECCNGNIYKITPELVYESAFDGDSLSREIFREVGHYLGIGIANIVNIFNPEAVILGGGLIGAWDLFIEELKEEFSRRALKPLAANVKILKTGLKEGGGAIGAAGLVFKASRQAKTSSAPSGSGSSRSG